MTTLSEQILLIDADDTLWENNVYFERAISDFAAWLHTEVDLETHPLADIRLRLDACEQASIAAHGYGVHSFRLSLADCAAQLLGVPLSQDQQTLIRRFTEPIRNHPIDLLPGVADTLSQLSDRHRLLFVTKGQAAEQLCKLERSGLAEHFCGVEVLLEKHQEAYRTLAAHYHCDHARTWMIGNSPKSDINPALAAGLHAVFLPHAQTWHLEHEELDPVPAGQTLLDLPSFAHLAQYF